MKPTPTSRPFAVFDIDGTLIRWQLYHAVADELGRHGHIPADSYERVKAARADWKRRSHPEAFKDYERQLVIAYEHMLQQISTKDFDQAVNTVIAEYKDQAYAYTRQLIADLKAQGYVLLAISGSQRELIAQLAEHYGFDDYIGTDYLRTGNTFTGEIVHHAGDKKKALESLIKKHGLSLAGSIAIGDSAGDIPMLELAERPIAFNPDQLLLKTARKRGWEIVVERKNVVYELRQDDGTYLLV